MRKLSFSLNASAIILIFAAVCLNTNQSLYYTPGPFKHWTEYLPFLALNLSAFLCALILQAEDILAIWQKKDLLLIRRELIAIGALYFLLGFEKYLCLLLIPANQFADLHFGFALITEAVFLADNLDIVFMFAAGVLLVRAFHLQDAPIDRKQRKRYLWLYVFLIFFIVLTGYFRTWIFINLDKFSWNMYSYNLLIIFCVFLFSLILQAEQIVPIIRNQKILEIHWELIALGIAAIFFAIMGIWMRLNIYEEAPSPIVQSIIGSPLWQISYSFAAGVFFVRAFGIKHLQTEL